MSIVFESIEKKCAKRNRSKYLLPASPRAVFQSPRHFMNFKHQNSKLYQTQKDKLYPCLLNELYPLFGRSIIQPWKGK